MKRGERVLILAHRGELLDQAADKLYKALDIIEKCNQLRAQEGKSELKVTDTLMAMAQADADYSVIAIGHAQQYQVAENCAFGGSNPFDGWYTSADGETLFDWNTQITEDTTIYAHWKRNMISWSENGNR